jgi:hypothetical protein
MNNRSISSSIRSSSLAVLAGVFCLVLSAGVWAQDSKPCADDAAKLCKGIAPGDARVAKCMKEHESELSPACKANIAKAKEELKEFSDACKEDVQKSCKGIKVGGGRILRCLKEHEATLSPACKQEMSKGGKK